MPVNFSFIAGIKRARTHKPRRIRTSWLATAVLVLLHLPGANATTNCNTVKLVVTSDAATKVLASIDKLIIETGFDCSIDIVATSTDTTTTDATADTLASLVESDEPAFASAVDVPTNQSGNPIRTANNSGSLHIVNDNPISGAGQGWWITPDAVEKHPELKTVLDVLEHPQLFVDSENSTLGVFFSCPVSSDCQHTNTNLFRAFKMQDKGWKLIIPDSWTDHELSISNATKKGQNWFGYYSSPSAVTGSHNMVKLDFGIEFAGNRNWDDCIAKPDCKDPRPSAWSPSQLRTVVNDSLKHAVPPAAFDYLSTRVLSDDVMSSLLNAQNDKRLNATETARLFLLQHTDIWTPWVSADTASKVTDSIATLH